MQRTIGHQSKAKANGTTNGHDGPFVKTYDLDACIVGAGFAGTYLLYQLRQAGFNVKIFEAGTELGGVWHWANYPGARVDVEAYAYAYSIPEVYETWEWTELYPDMNEIKNYFKHVDTVLDIKKDTLFKHHVVRATFDAAIDKWRIDCGNGVHITARFFLPCLGYAGRRHFPDWQGLEEFKGLMCHSSFWPAEGVDVKGKKVAVVGTGATGIQLSSAIAKEAAHLTCFVRTPNVTVPMRQRATFVEEYEANRAQLGDQLSRVRYGTWGGSLGVPPETKFLDATPEERETLMEAAWEKGGFAVAFAFADVLSSQEANDFMYDFWARKQRERMNDPSKRDLLIPPVKPYPFFGKRPSLEVDYYEQMDKPHVQLVDVSKNPITHAVETGVVTADGQLHDFDIIIFATGFDSHTGAYNEIDITGLHGEKLLDKWLKGVYSHLGMSVAGFPNMLYLYGPQSPGGFGTGPTVVEVQGQWIAGVLKKMRDQGLTKIEATPGAAQEWKDMVNHMISFTPWDKTPSWYNGANIPGKAREALQFAGGVALYRQLLSQSLEQDFKGFVVS